MNDMKKQSLHFKLLLTALIIITAFSSYTQKQFTHIASKDNNSCNGDCTLLDISELNNNANAIIWATPFVEKGINLNPHPIGVYYFQNQWRIFNLDQRPIPAGAKFTVEYVTSADKNYFSYEITNENLRKDGSAFIDLPALNNHPDAKFKLFPSWNPEIRGGITNREETSIQYNKEAGKWAINNINNKPLFARIVYNIALLSSGTAVSDAVQIVTANSNTVSGAVTHMYMTVWADGIKLPGESPVSGQQDKTELVNFELNASSPNLEQVTTKRKRLYDPVTVKKATGFAATIPLFKAFVMNQNITAIIDAYTTLASNGMVTLNYSIKLSGAHISGFKQAYEERTSANSGNFTKQYLDVIRIVFTKIEFIKGTEIVEDNL